MRVDEIRAARAAPRRPGEREQEERDEREPPRRALQVPDDPVAVRKPVVPEGRRRHDRDLEPGRAQVLHPVPHEHTRDLVRRPRIRRRENGEPHGERAARPKTTGRATASAAKT